jgi:hypothetical protein
MEAAVAAQMRCTANNCRSNTGQRKAEEASAAAVLRQGSVYLQSPRRAGPLGPVNTFQAWLRDGELPER